MKNKRSVLTRVVCWLGVAGLAVLIYSFALPAAIPAAWAVTLKVSGRGELCPWGRALTLYRGLDRFSHIYDEARANAKVLDQDAGRGMQLVSSPRWGPLWVRHNQGVEYLFAEHDWIAETVPEAQVRAGEVVIDVGAHVGVFTVRALARGAAKVIAIEPDPGNAECLRRNFAQAITEGRVVIVQEGAWSREGTMDLNLGDSSGWNSMVEKHGSKTIQVPVRKIDDMVKTLGLKRVDYIKMDIEGAEREALRGAMEVLKAHRPRLLIDSYHLPDDAHTLPALIRTAHADYHLECGPCQASTGKDRRLVPHVTYYY